MACDVCKKLTDEHHDLLPKYRTATVRSVCGSCLKKINRKKDFYMWQLSSRLTRKYIRKIAKEKPTTTDKPR